MLAKRLVMTTLLLTLALVLVLSACAKPAPAPAPAPTPAPTPAPAPKPATALEKLIEAAKKEGALNAMLTTGYGEKMYTGLAGKIKAKYGVDLDITVTPSGSMAKRMAAAIMEHETGAPPTFDVMIFSSDVITGLNRGVFERVDWKPILDEGTNPGVVMENAARGAIIVNTAHAGLMYNPEKVSAAEVPKTLAEFADPKWRGKIGIPVYTSTWMRWAYWLGIDKVLAELRAMVANGAIVEPMSRTANRYTLGEIPLAFLSSTFLQGTRDKGMPAEWQHIQIADQQDFSMVVRNGAKHPNAARLVAIYLASPEGARFLIEVGSQGNRYYPDNYDHDLAAQAEKMGLPAYRIATSPVLDFIGTDDWSKLMKEIGLILKGG